jgi:hypothetical protein
MKDGLRRIPDLSSGHRILRYLITSVWLVNGLWCKLLGMVPRHEMIAARVLELEGAGGLIKWIGIGEILMAAWVWSRIQPHLAAWAQIFMVTLMNILECWRAPDLLLFGKVNGLVACAFVVVVYLHGARRRSTSEPTDSCAHS